MHRFPSLNRLIGKLSNDGKAATELLVNDVPSASSQHSSSGASSQMGSRRSFMDGLNAEVTFHCDALCAVLCS